MFRQYQGCQRRWAQWAWLIGIVSAFHISLVALSHGQEVEPPTIPAKKLSKPPQIDGILHPDEWRDALVIRDFWFPARQQRGEFPTTAYLGYTDDALYVAFECEDPEPDKIRAQETKRGGTMENDDVVSVLIDPQNKRLEPYWFEVNPLGTQSESIPGGSTENIRWRGDWEAKARIHEKGWSAEIRIPFRILRYPSGQRQFGIALVRSIPRRQQMYVFPNMGAYFDERRHTVWDGVVPPAQRRPVIVMPFWLGDANGSERTTRGGLDVKYVAENGLTTLLTLQPDFENIAGDVASVDFSYTEKALAETRPFFQEGKSFLPPSFVFYSPRVQELNAGLKSFGTLGNWSYGILGGEYEVQAARRRLLTGRLRYQTAPHSFIGVIGLSNAQGGVNERLWGGEIDLRRITDQGEWRLTALSMQLEGDREGHYRFARLERGAPERNLSWYLQWDDISPDYRPRLAFVPERGWRGIDLQTYYFDRPQGGTLLWWAMRIGGRIRRLYQGGTLDEGVSIGSEWLYRNHMAWGVELNYLRRPPHIDRTLGVLVRWNTLDLYRNGFLYALTGEQNGGRSLYITLEQKLELAPRLRLGIQLEQLHIDYPDTPDDDRSRQAIITLNYEITPERVLGGRWVVNRIESGGEVSTTHNFYLTYMQRVRRGLDIYLIYGLPNANRTQNRLAIKFVTPMEW
jgi:hypothetical protein